MPTADQTGEMQHFTIDTLKQDDIPHLQDALTAWIRDSDTHEVLTDEVAEVNRRMLESIHDNNGYHYFVARDGNGYPVGVMGIRTPEEGMMQYALTTHPAELVNAYMASGTRGQGVGKMLIHHLFTRAKDLGYTEVILNSGPRYKDSAWSFYDHIFGGNAGIAKDYYGEGYHAPVWRKVL